MGTAKVSDIRSFFPGMTGINDSKAGAVSGTEDFAKMISDAASKTASVQTADSSQGVQQAPKSTRPVQKADSPDNGRIRTDSESDKGGVEGKKTGEVDREKLKEAVDEKADKVKEAIKDELGVSDEEIEDAMARMGIVSVDLLNADDLKGLMMELSGETDPLALITNEELLSSINEVIDVASEMAAELFEEFKIPIEELANIPGIKPENDPLNAEFAGEGVIEDDGNEGDDADRGVRVEINRSDDTPDIHAMSGSTKESASLDRKAAGIMDNRKQEDGLMQNAMTGQNQVTDTAGAENAVQAAEGFTSSYVDNEDILRQVADRIKLDIGADKTAMELQLHPASLGTVNLQVTSQGGVITAHFMVQNDAVKSALEGQLVQLLQTFEEQGQKVEAIEVSVAGYDLDKSLNQNSDTGSNERQERKAEGVGRTSRRRLNLNELNEEDIEELTEEEQLAAEMMSVNGGSVDYKA